MSLAEVEKEALALPEADRAELAAALLRTLCPEPGPSDEEVLHRDREVECGCVAEISHEEFVRRVERDRR